MLTRLRLLLLLVVSVLLVVFYKFLDKPSIPTSESSLASENINKPDAIDELQVVQVSQIATEKEILPETILERQQVPILCYHQVRNWKADDSEMAKTYIVEPERFKQQMQMLADSGYTSVLPDQLYDYLTKGTLLPDKPVMITFDDTNLDQFTVAAPELEKHNFRGVFFVMTVSLSRPRYMSREQVKILSDAGHVIGSHTWDHQNVKKYQGKDWEMQVEKPARVLEEITGKPTDYFAYPFGLWNEEVIPELKRRQVKAAFQLAEKRDTLDPLYTVRRIIASGYWSDKQLYNSMKRSF